MKRLPEYFFQGLLLIAPLVITVYIIVTGFRFIDNLLDDVIPYKIPGLGILVVFFLITVIGFIGKTIVIRPFSAIISRALQRTPLIKMIYSSVKDLLSAFVGQKKKFDQPVIVKVSKLHDLEKFGFITQKDLKELGVEEKKVAVYFPHSFAFSGELFVVPAENIRTINASPTEVMKFIISGGVTKI